MALRESRGERMRERFPVLLLPGMTFCLEFTRGGASTLSSCMRVIISVTTDGLATRLTSGFTMRPGVLVLASSGGARALGGFGAVGTTVMGGAFLEEDVGTTVTGGAFLEEDVVATATGGVFDRLRRM